MGASADHACAGTSAGSVHCWAQAYAAFNIPDYGQSTVPADLGLAAAVAMGSYHSCALLITGTVRCVCAALNAH